MPIHEPLQCDMAPVLTDGGGTLAQAHLAVAENAFLAWSAAGLSVPHVE
jgi:hypothetical protein